MVIYQMKYFKRFELSSNTMAYEDKNTTYFFDDKTEFGFLSNHKSPILEKDVLFIKDVRFINKFIESVPRLKFNISICYFDFF